MTIFLAVPNALAQAVRTRILSGFEVKEVPPTRGSFLLTVRFSLPVRYLRHSPLQHGRLLQIELTPLALAEGDEEPILGRESLPVLPAPSLALDEIGYEGNEGSSSLVLRFTRDQLFEVRQGADFRSLEVLLTEPSQARKGRLEASRAARLLAEGRRAMTVGELARAVAIFEAILADHEADDDLHRDAQELLGLARERNGQLAHARAEYENYLARYPTGEAAERVRQRLRVIETAEASPRKKLREAAPRKSAGGDFDIYGSTATSYLHGRNLIGEFDDPTFDSTLIADLNLSSRYETERFTVAGEVASSYRYDFRDSRTADDARLSTLLVQLRDRQGWSATLGRQSRSNGGVLGRFDGLRMAAEVGRRIELSGLFGFPLASTTSTRVSLNRQLFGVALNFDEILRGLDGQLYGVARRVDGLFDRVAVGGELRYASANYFGLAFVDVDAYLGSLNTLLLTGTYRFAAGANVHAQLETRNSPVLALENALQGQAAEDLEELSEDYSRSELRKLAKDRTARSYRASVGASRPLGTDRQIGADLIVSSLEGTPASGGVPGTQGTGVEVGASAELTQGNLFMRGGVGGIGLRTFIGDIYDSYGLRINARFPLMRAMRIQPRIFTSFRRHKRGGADLFDLRPSLRAGLCLRGFDIDAELGLDWAKSFGAPTAQNELSLLVEIVLRYDF